MSLLDPFGTFMRDPFFSSMYDPFGTRAIEGGAGQGPGTTALSRRSTDPSSALWAPTGWRFPRMDVTEEQDKYLIKADIPGLAKENIQISIDERDMLTISGERKDEKVEESATRHLTERTYGRFSRSFRLPSDVNPDSCHAKMEHGVLEVCVDKRPPQESGRKRIQVS